MTHRVLMTTDTVGGVWTYALDLVDALAACDVEVHLATMGPPMSVHQRTAVAATAVAQVHESEFALEWMHDPWPDVDQAGEWLLSLERDIGADVVHLNGFAHGALEWRAAVVTVAHSDVLSWWQAVRREDAGAEWAEYRRRVTHGLAAADAVVAPTAAYARAVAHLYGREPVVVRNGRREGWVRRDVHREPLVLGAGRVWDEAKNLAALERVAPLLSWPVVVAGEADRDAHGARFLGRLPFGELAPWLARASVFVLPARYEPFGLGPLEAAMSGCALVLGDIGSLREVWDGAALFVDPDDDAAIVSAIERLVADGALRARCAADAEARARTFTADRMAAAYARLYTELSTSRAPKVGAP